MSGHRPLPDDPTERTSASTGNTLSRLRTSAAQRLRLTLVVFHAQGTESAPLEPGVPVTVGRQPTATLAVPSGKLSRIHARFTLGAEGLVKVEDLGSTNGTWLRGARIEAAEITIGDEVLVGDALVCVQAVAPADRPAVAPVSRARDSAEEPIAASSGMRDVLRTAERVASSSVPVILQGETGTGKEVLARFLHDRGPRASRPMISVNCAAIPASLLESALFGHERGSFTGAGQRQKGVFEEADGGTVFLDEIGELPLAAQAALLRVLETGTFSRVGSPHEIAVDVRVIAATHRDLEALRDSGAFRADLYYRLGVMVIAIPALRERPEDIEPLVRRFIARAGGRVRDLTPAALAHLRAYPWPGNIRELRNTIDRAVVLARGDLIDEVDLPARMREESPGTGPLTAVRKAAPAGEAALPGAADLKAQVQEYESRVLLEALQATGWNQSEAARRLGIPKRTFAYRVKTLGLKKPPG